jgi:Ca2+-binding RTX toxin-like protein
MGTWNPGPGATAGNDTFAGDANNDTADGLAGNDTLLGNGGDDVLIGNAGNDWLIGGAGLDSFFGGPGDDLFNDVEAGETVNELPNEGIDTIRSESLTFFDLNTTPNVENLSLVRSAAIFVFGNALANMISVLGSSSELHGGAGNDI